MLDTAKMKQVILNLCSNAIEAMPEGGCLTLKSYHSGQAIVLEIGDTGVGVPRIWMFSRYSKPQKLAAAGWGFLSCSRLSRPITARSTTRPSRATGPRLRFHCRRQI